MKLQTYKIMRTESGARIVKLASGARIPAGIAGLCAGDDKWISEIEVKCRNCGDPWPLKQMQGEGQWCEFCSDASIED